MTSTITSGRPVTSRDSLLPEQRQQPLGIEQGGGLLLVTEVGVDVDAVVRAA